MILFDPKTNKNGISRMDIILILLEVISLDSERISDLPKVTQLAIIKDN